MDGLDIVDTPSPNFDERDQPVSMVVLHYTGMEDGAAAIERLRDPDSRVSCHYLIEEDGTIHRMVPEEKRAWHAGQSYWRGTSGINDVSIGIELVNPGHEFGYRAYPDAQIDALLPLMADIKERYGYDSADGRAAIAACQRRWRPRRIDGELDGEVGALLFELLLERDLGHAT